MTDFKDKNEALCMLKTNSIYISQVCELLKTKLTTDDIERIDNIIFALMNIDEAASFLYRQ